MSLTALPPTAATVARLELLRRYMPKAPLLPVPDGPGHRTVPVASVAELVAAISNARPGDVLLLADGVYSMPDGVTVLTDDVQIRGASQDPARVILDGTEHFTELNSALLRIKRAQHVTVANLTFRNSRKYGLLFYGDASVHHLHVYNCRFHNVWARGLKGTSPARPEDNPANGVNPPEVVAVVRPRHGRIEYCEFTADHRKTDLADGFQGDYIAGFDMMGLDDWTIAHNLFFNLQGATGFGRGAVFIWVGSQNLTIEHNCFVDCDRSIALGNPSQVATLNLEQAVIRHNFIVNHVNRGIECHATRHIHVHDNRIYATTAAQPLIECVSGAQQVRFERNTIHGKLVLDPEVQFDRTGHHPEPIPPPDDPTLISLLTKES